MIEPVSENLSYPEHHAEWLDVMGISRWKSREAIGIASISEQGTTEVALARDAGHSVESSCEKELPEIIQIARYWVLGAEYLTEEEALLLAGMMAAIKASMTDVVYSWVSEDAHAYESEQDTNLSTWPKLNVFAVTDMEFKLPEHLKVLLLGHLDFPFDKHPHVWQIQSLADILAAPLLKREAWEKLKSMRAQ